MYKINAGVFEVCMNQPYKIKFPLVQALFCIVYIGFM